MLIQPKILHDLSPVKVKCHEVKNRWVRQGIVRLRGIVFPILLLRNYEVYEGVVVAVRIIVAVDVETSILDIETPFDRSIIP